MLKVTCHTWKGLISFLVAAGLLLLSFLGGGFCLFHPNPFTIFLPSTRKARSLPASEANEVNVDRDSGLFRPIFDPKRLEKIWFVGVWQPYLLSLGRWRKGSQETLWRWSTVKYLLVCSLFDFNFELLSKKRTWYVSSVFSLLGHLKYQRLCKMAVLGNDYLAFVPYLFVSLACYNSWDVVYGTKKVCGCWWGTFPWTWNSQKISVASVQTVL